tara:strand:- start:832 stop:1122 length:291 start_codon:yes stop_codon:yes gene_type:complete
MKSFKESLEIWKKELEAKEVYYGSLFERILIKHQDEINKQQLQFGTGIVTIMEKMEKNSNEELKQVEEKHKIDILQLEEKIKELEYQIYLIRNEEE